MKRLVPILFVIFLVGVGCKNAETQLEEQQQADSQQQVLVENLIDQSDDSPEISQTEKSTPFVELISESRPIEITEQEGVSVDEVIKNEEVAEDMLDGGTEGDEENTIADVTEPETSDAPNDTVNNIEITQFCDEIQSEYSILENEWIVVGSTVLSLLEKWSGFAEYSIFDAYDLASTKQSSVNSLIEQLEEAGDNMRPTAFSQSEATNLRLEINSTANTFREAFELQLLAFSYTQDEYTTSKQDIESAKTSLQSSLDAVNEAVSFHNQASSIYKDIQNAFASINSEYSCE
ncbi:hypothetical protein EPN81_00110 [Patescibacteria group bacterium]|nr:MAG: hypothetical protein EPN81_00110 [Patescibacteria group bacterium]